MERWCSKSAGEAATTAMARPSGSCSSTFSTNRKLLACCSVTSHLSCNRVREFVIQEVMIYSQGMLLVR
jgi:hypothetical protein